MGLLLSVIISYAGVNEAIECMKHIINGIVPNTEPDFTDLVEYYTILLHKSQKTANPSPLIDVDWRIRCQGYLSLIEDNKGRLKTASIKFYNEEPDSTAIFFSTKISSFGQESIDSNNSLANGGCNTERYIQPTTKTIISNSLESFSVGNRNRSPTPCETVSDPIHFSKKSSERDHTADTIHNEDEENQEKLTWLYRPKSPTRNNLPEIQFESYDGDNSNENYHDEHFLRSLDGIKFRPLRRSDPSGRRRSYKKRQSSSSNSSKDSRASREEELKIFTSLEEAEFERMNKEENFGGFGSTPNLVARSHSRSRSRENSKERRNEHWSMEGSMDSVPEDGPNTEAKPKLKDMPKLDSFEEEHDESKENQEVIEVEDEIDFWGNNED